MRKLHLPKGLASSTSLAIIGAAIVLVIAGTAYFIQQERQRTAINEQIAKTNQLIEQTNKLGEETKKLSEDNKRLNQENKDYAFCTAQLIAKYTRDGQGITIDDLRTCALSSFAPGSEPRGLTGDIENTALQEVMRSDGNVVEVPRPIAPTPTSPTNPTNPTPNNQGNQQQNSSDLLEVPNVLDLNLPCLNVLGLIKTCKE